MKDGTWVVKDGKRVPGRWVRDETGKRTLEIVNDKPPKPKARPAKVED